MKPKPKRTERISFEVGPVIINRDDLEQIIAIATTAGYEAAYSDDTAEFDSLDDVVTNRGHKPKNLLVVFNKPKEHVRDLYLEITGANIKLTDFLSSDKAVPYEMRDALSTLMRWWGKIAKPWNWFIGLAIVAAFINAFAQYVKMPVILLAILSIPLVGLLYSYIYRNFFCGLNLHRTHEANFFRRNSDRIALLVVGAILGVFGTLAVQFFTPDK